MEKIIEVKNLNKEFRIPKEKRDSVREFLFKAFNKRNYNNFKALNDLSFDVKKGEFLGIVGRNGSGKSTLLKILSGVYYPCSGEVEVRGEVSPFLELGIGFNAELSARDNIFLNAAILKIPKGKVEEKFDEIIEFAELEEFVDMKLKHYSSGMYVRLAFSVAIQAEAEIFIMDEVLAVGDINFQKKCFAVFDRFKEEGKTVILVSHNFDNIRNYCDRVLLLHKGENHSVGSPEEIFEKYNQLN